MRQGKDDMCVGGLEDLTFPGGEPRGLRGAMAFGAATVAAGVVRLDLMVTMVTLRDMAPEGRGPYTTMARKARCCAPERVGP